MFLGKNAYEIEVFFFVKKKEKKFKSHDNNTSNVRNRSSRNFNNNRFPLPRQSNRESDQLNKSL